MEPNTAPRRLWHVVRAVLFMLRKSMSKRKKLSMDIQLLLHRSKIAGKALGKLITAHGHHDDHPTPAKAPRTLLSCRALDPALAVYNSHGATGREVEFSCSNTPSYNYPPIQLIPAKRGRRRSSRRTHRGANGAEPGWYNYDAADIAKVFEVLSDEQLLKDVGLGDSTPLAVLATPSPALWSSFGRSPAAVRQLRITDSPFPLRDDAADQDGGLVDQEADEFIRKFYDQLRTQQSLAVATPEYGYARPATGVAY